MNTTICDILNNFKRPLRKIAYLHYKDYRYLLPESIKKFPQKNKFRHDNVSYDLYGWSSEQGLTIIDIYPTYKNIITKEDLPLSWQNYIQTIKNITNVDKILLLIYNKKYNKYTNVIDFSVKTTHNINPTHIVRSDWTKATGLKNFIMDDTILDIINKNNMNESNINVMSDISEEKESLIERLNMGNEFERNIIDCLINKYYLYFVKICESYDAKSIEKYKQTLYEIEKGTPIIHQAVLHDPISKIYGCVDLLVRSDWLNKIFISLPDNYNSSDEINNKIHYVVIDIKFHRLQYNSDGMTLRNEGMMKVFKSQLYIYNKALGYMQNYLPKHAYILGRGWIKTNTEQKVIIVEKNNDPFDKLGIIDFRNNDNNILVKSEDGLKWLDELKNNEFDETKPKYNHCYPNMNNTIQLSGKKRKLNIAEDNNELTMISYIGVKQRKIALEHGINNYMDPNLTGGKLGLTGKTEKIINTLIENQRDLDKPIKGEYNCPSLKNVEVFLDYEYMYSFDSDENIPYLCGIGYVVNSMPEENIITTESTIQWNFEYVLLDDISMASRSKMCESIINILEKIKATHIYTWSDVDRRLLTNESKKFNLDNRILDLKWIDMYKFCLTNHINFKGAKGYGLKEIGRVLNENKLTTINWKNNLSSSSVVGATKHYYKLKKWNPKNLIEYNHIDCRMIYEILTNLRVYQINKI
jgi:hypothetical protein